MMRPEDWSGLAPERDRPAAQEFDWTPEALNLTAPAARLVRLDILREMHDDEWAIRTYNTAMGVWCDLTGMDEASALTYAYGIAHAVPPVMGTVPPF